MSLDFFFYQLHRDTRLAELIGDMVVVREEDAQSGGEIIRTVNRPGGILTSQICVLDDVSRAPGEALNVLLRILNERKFEKRKLPLMTAIATGNPPGEAYYSEPLDPANLDRFTVQIKSGGLVSQGAWAGVADVIARYESQGEVGLDAIDVAGAVSPGLIAACNESLPQVTLPEEVVDGLLSLLQSLVNCYDLDPGNAILSDRTFLVKAVRILKACSEPSAPTPTPNRLLEGSCDSRGTGLLRGFGPPCHALSHYLSGPRRGESSLLSPMLLTRRVLPCARCMPRSLCWSKKSSRLRTARPRSPGAPKRR